MIESVYLKGKPVKHLTALEFTKAGRTYNIIGCTTTGKGAYDCVDTVRNDKGEYKEFTRMELINFIESK